MSPGRKPSRSPASTAGRVRMIRATCALVQRGDRERHREVRLAGAGRADPEGDGRARGSRRRSPSASRSSARSSCRGGARRRRSNTSRTSWSASSAPSTASTVCAPIWWPPSTSSTSSSITSRASATFGVVALERQLVPAQADRAAGRSRSASSTPSPIPASSAATAFETSRVSCIHPSVGGVPAAAAACPCVYVEAMERKWWTLVAVCVAIFMLLLDITIVNVALPAIERALDAIVLAISSGSSTPTRSTLATLRADRRRARRPVRAQAALRRSASCIFTVASAVCGAANDPLFLIIARGVQGIGGAIDVRDRARAALAGVPRHASAAPRSGSGARRPAPPSRSGRSPAAMLTVVARRGAGSSSSTSRSASARSLLALGEAARVERSRARAASTRSALVTLTGGLFCLVLALIEGNKRGLDERADRRRCSSARSSCSPAFIVTAAAPSECR